MKYGRSWTYMYKVQSEISNERKEFLRKVKIRKYSIILTQILIVLAEVGVGLALITGTFTFIAALAGLALNVNFILSTGLYSYNWWYIPAALCLLGGAGRAFGVDYYLIPYLMRQWRYFTRNRGIKLFLWR
jgi:NADH dehydrogenase